MIKKLSGGILALFGMTGAETGLAAACGPVYGADGIAVDKDGKVWMTHYEDMRLSRLDPLTGEFAEFLPTTKGNANTAARDTWTKQGGFDYAFDFGMMGIALDEANGLVWTRRFNDDKVLRFSAVDRQFTELELPGQTPARFEIPMDNHGNLWMISSKGMMRFTEGKAVKISPSGQLTVFPLPWEKFGGGGAIAVDRAGNPWVSATPEGGRAELYAWSGSAFVRQSLPDVGRYLASLHTDARGDLWFAAGDRNAIGRLRNGKVELFEVPTANAAPTELTSDPEGNLWFTEWFGNKLGRVNRDGRITEYALPPEEETPLAIAADREGRIWFSVAFNYSLFRLDPDSGRITEFPVPVPSNWSRDAAHGASFCTMQRKDSIKVKPTKAELSAATEQMVHRQAIRHPEGYPKDRAAVLFEQKCQTACHTWYRVDKAASRRADWGPTVDRMIEANGAAMTRSERDRIVRFMNKRYARLQ